MTFELPETTMEVKHTLLLLVVYWLGYVMGWINAYKIVWIG